MPLLFQDYLQVSNYYVPYRTYTEKRNTIRSALGAKGGILRLPIFLNKDQRHDHIQNFLLWFKERLAKHPEYLEGVGLKDYTQYSSIKTIFGSFDVQHIDRKSTKLSAEIKDQKIVLLYNKDYRPGHLNELLRSLILQALANLCYMEVVKIVIEINTKYINKEIDHVVLSDTSTKWGSCSSRKRIQLSTKLLFSTKEVLKSVIAHELVHLVHFRHDAAFYKLLNEIDPANKNSTQWLNEFGHTCNL